MRQLRRHALLALGWVALGLGVIGIVVPLLPTAPFVLLAAACFMRSSERLHTWLVGHPVLGCHVEDYLAGRGLRARTKAAAIVAVWISVMVSVLFVVPILAVDLLLVTAAVGVSIYVLRIPTCRAEFARTRP